MNENSSSCDSNNHQKPTVTSVGNAWVICDSKSRPGFKYYFNTLSGQAVWNLSPEEIEKAKKFTKALPISEIEKCPEPAMDPPMDSSSQPAYLRTMNDQPARPLSAPMHLLSNLSGLPNLKNISGLAPNLNLSGLQTNINNVSGLPGNISNISGLPTNMNISGLPTNMNLSGLPTNMNLSGLPTNMSVSGLPTNINSLSQMPANILLGPNISGLNPFIWNTSANNQNQTQQTPIIYVVQPGFPSQQLSTHQFNNVYASEQNSIHKSLQQDFPRNREDRTQINQIQFNRNKPDLRQKLDRKRTKSMSSETSYANVTIKTEDTKNITPYLSQNDLQEETSKYDLSVLNRLKPLNSTITNWLIVADTQIILENFPFLNKVTDRDQNCYLVVPDHVMHELQSLVSEGSDMPTRRILRFLKEQIEYELAIRGNKIENAENMNNSYKMYVTCRDLAQQNNVILLSNDPHLETFKDVHVNIHVVRLSAFKLILNDKSKTRFPRINSPTLDIKIHVPNNTHVREERPSTSQTPDFTVRPRTSINMENMKSHVREERPSTSQTPDFTVRPHIPINMENMKTLPPLKETVENNRAHSETHGVKTTQATQHSENNTNETANPTISAKTSEPAENESSFHSPPKINVEQKNSSQNNTQSRNARSSVDTENSNTQSRYRWRRRRAGSSKTEAPNPPEQTVNTESPRQEPTNSPDRSNLLEEFSKKNISTRAGSFDRSSTTSYPKTIERPNMIIEETSTSGIISNSTEADCLNRKDSVSIAVETVSIIEDVEFVRHQVVGQNMEEVLKTRREEWVLRYVQIMEEALRDVLRHNSRRKAEGSEYTPPWPTDLPELSKYIIKKFSDHFNVVDAANRLSFTLHKISDSKGNISTDIEPRQYMDLYSYGVYLINALKQVTVDCEDLSTAEKSLKKLLRDIQNASQDCGHTDTFLDDPSESVTNYVEEDTDEPRLYTMSDSEKQSSVQNQSCRNSISSIAYTPRFETPTPVSREPLQRQFSNAESNFFSSLSLTKRSSDRSINTPSSTPNSARIAQTPPLLMSPRTSKASSKIVPNINVGVAFNISNDNAKGCNERADKTNANASSTPNTSPVKVVRKFTNIPLFEEKFKNKEYDIFDDEYEEYDDGDELEDGEICEQEYDNYVADEEMIQKTSILENESNDVKTDFQSFIREFADEISRPILLVQKLCATVLEDIKNSRKPSEEEQNKLKKAITIMTKMNTNLKSILTRDSVETDKDLIELLRKANLHAYVPNKELLTLYTNIIKDCLTQLDKWHQVASKILAASKSSRMEN